MFQHILRFPLSTYLYGCKIEGSASFNYLRLTVVTSDRHCGNLSSGEAAPEELSKLEALLFQDNSATEDLPEHPVAKPEDQMHQDSGFQVEGAALPPQLGSEPADSCIGSASPLPDNLEHQAAGAVQAPTNVTPSSLEAVDEVAPTSSLKEQEAFERGKPILSFHLL